MDREMTMGLKGGGGLYRQIASAAANLDGSKDRGEDIGVVVRHLLLQNGGDTLHSHACASNLALELKEYESCGHFD
jgi:hypothetical protein